MADVFISYKRTERAIIERLRDELVRLKVDVWFDARLEAGESFNQEITREARAARAILVCWSPDAATSDWVQAEALIGLEEGKLVASHVVPMAMSVLPVPFNSKHTIDLTGWVAGSSVEGWREIVARIAVLVRRPGLRDFVRLPDAGAVSSAERLKALEAWAAANGDDPLAEDVWHEIETLETEEQKRRVAERKAKAAAEAAARAPRAQSPDEREAMRDAAQGKAWRALGDRPSTEKLRAFVREWKSGPLVELARRELNDRDGKGKGGSGASGLLGAAAALLVVAGVAAALWVSGVLRPEVDPADAAAWAIAQDLGVEAAYESYLERFPEGAHAAEARAEIQRAADDRRKVAEAETARQAFAAAKAGGTVAAFEQFLKDWPNSAEAAEARTELQRLNKAADDAAWAEADRVHTVEGYRAYLASQPNGAYRNEAEAGVNRLEQAALERAALEARDREAWATAQRANAIAGFSGYLREFPNGLFAVEARAARDRLQTAADDAEADALLAAARRRVDQYRSVADAGDRDCNAPFTVYFEWDRSNLTASGDQYIRESVAKLTSLGCTIRSVLVTGHSDTSHPKLYAMKLTDRRAATVRGALVQYGVSDSLITAVGLGEGDLDRATRDGVREPLNRRVEVEIVATMARSERQPSGAPSAPIVSSTVDFVVRAPDIVYFDADSAQLNESARRALDAQAAWLRSYPSVRIRLAGSTDDSQSRDYSLALGARMANTVRDYLVAKGVDASRIETVSYGKDRPIAPGSTPESRAQNRYVKSEIISGALQ